VKKPVFFNAALTESNRQHRIHHEDRRQEDERSIRPYNFVFRTGFAIPAMKANAAAISR
jgi:hypothetical protein